MGNGAGIVGGLVTVGLGVIVVAAIFQLNSSPNVTNATTTIATSTLNNLFK